MSMSSSPLPPFGGVSKQFSPLRLIYWSMRRELWEYRSLVMGPVVGFLAVFAFYLFLVSLLVTHGFHHDAGVQLNVGDDWNGALFVSRFLALIGIAVGLHYSSSTLMAERRERTILFWKSLPVSDTNATLAKILAVLLVVPVVVIALSWLNEMIVTCGALVMGSPRAFAASGFVALAQQSARIMLLLVVWAAPLYGWAFLISGSVKRAPGLWIAGVPLLLPLGERVFLGTHAVWDVLAGYVGLGVRLLSQGGGCFSIGPRHEGSHDLLSMDTQPVCVFDASASFAHLATGLGICAVVACVLFTVTILRRRRAEPV